MLFPRVLLVPSSPTLLIEERRGSTTAMLDALAAQSVRFDADRPDAFVVVTSRWSGGPAFLADDAKRHTSLIDRPGFGIEPRYDCTGEPELARALVHEARLAGLHAACARRGADSGVSVPLHFLAASRFARVVPASLAAVPPAAHRAWGAALRRSMTAWSGRAMLVVSGSLTFHEHSFNLKREIRDDRELDALAIGALQGSGWSSIERRAARFPGKSHPEAAWLHLEVLRGFLGEALAGRLCAYEALPGIGEALVEFDLEGAPAEPAEVATSLPVARAHVDPRRRTGTWRAPSATGAPAGPPRPASSRPSSSRPSSSRPSSSRPFSPRPSSPRPARNGSPRGAGPPRGPRSGSARPSRPPSARPASSRPTSSRPFSPRPSSSRPNSARPGSPRPGSSRPGSPRPGASRPSRGPSSRGPSSRPPRRKPAP